MSWLKRQVLLLVAAYNRWSQDEGPALAAAVAYYVALSFFPLVLTLITGIGLFFRFAHSGQDAERAVLVLVREHFSSSAGSAVEQALNQVRDTSTFHGPIRARRDVVLFDRQLCPTAAGLRSDRTGHRLASQGDAARLAHGPRGAVCGLPSCCADSAF